MCIFVIVFSVHVQMVLLSCRYLVVEVVSESGSVRMNTLLAAVKQAVKKLHGDFGLAAVTPGFGGKAQGGGGGGVTEIWWELLERGFR